MPDTSLDHHYRAALKQFVQDAAVRPILGKALEKDCKKLDDGQLAAIWATQYQQPPVIQDLNCLAVDFWDDEESGNDNFLVFLDQQHSTEPLESR